MMQIIRKYLNIFEYLAYFYAFLFLLLQGKNTSFSWIVYFIVMVGAFYIVKESQSIKDNRNKNTYTIFGFFFALFSVFIYFSVKDIDSLHLYFLMNIFAVFGMTLFYRRLLYVINIIYSRSELLFRKTKFTINCSVKTITIISFLLVFLEMILFLLNEYPGCMLPDQSGVVKQAALGTEGGYDNINPFLNSIFIILGVKTGMLFSSDFNLGVAIYTFIQLLFYSLAVAYSVTSIYRRKFNIAFTIVAQLFFMVMPYNMVFATGQWKDCFFGICLLVTVTYTWNYIEKREHTKYERLGLAFWIMISCLARNVSWPSFFVASIIFVACELKTIGIKRSISVVSLVGVLCALIIQYGIYPACGIENTNTSYGLSLPLQMMARTIVEEDNYTDCLSEEEKNLLDEVVDEEHIKNYFSPSLADSTWWGIDRELYFNHKSEINKIIFKIGLRYPYLYLDEFIQMTGPFWSLERVGFLWNYFIYEGNVLGIVRNGLIFNGHNLYHVADWMYFFPQSKTVFASGWNLWILMLIALGGIIYKNNKNIYISLPLLGMYALTILIAPTAQFRYVYQVAICLPILICILFESKYTEDGVSVKS